MADAAGDPPPPPPPPAAEDPFTKFRRTAIAIVVHLTKDDQDPTKALDYLEKFITRLAGGLAGECEAYAGEYQVFLFSNTFPKSVQALADRQYYPDMFDDVAEGKDGDAAVAADVGGGQAAHVAHFFERLAALAAQFLAAGLFLTDLTPLLNTLFNESHKFYQEFGFPEPAPASPSTEDDETTAAWRAKLGVSDWIDAIRKDRNNENKKEWSRGVIHDENENGDHLLVSYENVGDTCDRWIARDSREIAELGEEEKRGGRAERAEGARGEEGRGGGGGGG
jgi:hypothetical protein